MTEADLARLHNDAITKDPFISAALGPNAKLERMRAASLRLGSQGVKKSFDDHLLIIGDAAGARRRCRRPCWDRPGLLGGQWCPAAGGALPQHAPSAPPATPPPQATSTP